MHDISVEGFIESFDRRYPTFILKTLLCDRTTGRNIIWADNEYEALGDGYMGDDEMTVEKITGMNSGVIKPRIAKEQEKQSQRTKSRAEVFTPSWLCNQMNNDLDEAWFGRRDVFNTEIVADDGANTWTPTSDPIEFPKSKGHGWRAYVEATRLEITCGEAPFVCSRYDTVTGDELPVSERVGFLDRKLRVVTEKTKTRKEWVRRALDALRATYGFEYQGDNLLIARVNVLDNLKEAFKQSVTAPLVQAAKESYGSELKPRQQQQIERKVQADADIQLNRQVGDYQIQARRIEQSRKDELKAATSETERAEVNKRHDEQKAEAFQTLAQKLEDSREELVQRAGETVVREVETTKKEDEKQGIEDKVRAHLRGFSRTIPSFLMAYGEEGTTLANFDTVIPADVFQDVTSITVDEFRFLRDGGDYTDGETGEVKRFVGHLFDEVVFNDSVSEFIKLRERLANYFDESQTEDIFDYVPPQKTNQIFTPRNVVVQMVDLFEKENPGCFDDPSHTFADLYMKSGLYITEIIKRLYRSEGMKAAFPDDRERLDHILEHQVFGIAPTKIIYEIATHFILGFHDEVGQGCDSNFELADAAELAKEGTLEAYVERVFGPKLGEA